MILQALVRCYESLAAARKLEKSGWSMVKVSWGLELTPEGQIQRLWPLEIADAKGKKRPQLIKLPAQTKKNGWGRFQFSVREFQLHSRTRQ